MRHASFLLTLKYISENCRHTENCADLSISRTVSGAGSGAGTAQWTKHACGATRRLAFRASRALVCVETVSARRTYLTQNLLNDITTSHSCRRNHKGNLRAFISLLFGKIQ